MVAECRVGGGPRYLSGTDDVDGGDAGSDGVQATVRRTALPTRPIYTRKTVLAEISQSRLKATAHSLTMKDT